ncbi:SpoIIE family protein phosphatase [Streptomyces sp. NPDC020362]|uniref:SpoIIE family protein phosphatase n=1 Tax=unclassified Streptomyces TaxID=2593676 RepID=UPI000B1B482F
MQQSVLAGTAGENVVNDAYLVPREHCEEFWAEATHAADGLQGVRIEVTRLHRGIGPFHRTEHRRTLSPGSTLLLYTDGLIEHPGHDIDAAIAQLVSLPARHGDDPLPDLVRRISKRLADPHPGDNVVVLAVHVP